MDQNSVNMIGRLTRDPEVKWINSKEGQLALVSFSLAVNERPRNGEKLASFFDVTAWGKVAEAVGQYMKKGSQVGISGSLKQETWLDKATGAKRSKVVINASSVQFLGAPGAARAEASRAEPESRAPERPAPATSEEEFADFTEREDGVPF